MAVTEITFVGVLAERSTAASVCTYFPARACSTLTCVQLPLFSLQSIWLGRQIHGRKWVCASIVDRIRYFRTIYSADEGSANILLFFPDLTSIRQSQ